jgi:hypothetical protein
VDEDLPVIEVKNAVSAWLRSQPDIFFAGGIRKLWDNCAISVQKLDDYVEK